MRRSENESGTQLEIWIWPFDCPADGLSLVEYTVAAKKTRGFQGFF